jgi:hypothetical protein
MTRQNDTRQLVPAYHHRGLLVGWRCSVCGKDFRVSLEDATDEFAPTKIRGEFQNHSCAETLLDQYRERNQNAS